ncbi:MAG: ABC transporter ATP-binding protein [Chloroflexia bacterium]
MRLPPLNKVSGVRNALLHMLALAWQTFPLGVVGIISLNLLSGLIPVATAWITKLIFDQLAQVIRTGPQSGLGTSATSGSMPNTFPRELLILLGIQAVIMVLGRVISPLNGYLNAEAGRRLQLKTQSVIYRKINSLQGLAPFEDPRFYDTFQLASGGGTRGPSQAISISMNLLQSTVTLVGLLGVLLPFSPLLAGAVGLTILPQLYTYLKMGRQRFDVAVRNSPKERRAAYYGQVLSGLQYAKEIRLFNLTDYFMNMFLSTYKEIHGLQRAQQRRELRWQAALEVLGSLVAVAALTVVILEAFAGGISIGDVTLYASAVASTQVSLASVIVALANVNENVLFYKHYTRLLEMPQPLPANNDGPQPVPALKLGIEFRNVSFRYSAEHPWVLRNLNLRIPAGRCMALVGLNGAGKTTLAKLLTRMYDPTEGEILWDGTDIRRFAPQELRQHIGAIFQDFVRYDLTAQENIGLGNVANLDDTRSVQLAAVRAGIHDVIEALPQGYQTVISRWLTDETQRVTNNGAGGAGIDLSGGEWQKVALARMFMREADLLILDEPTASLDVQAEHDLYSRFVELMAGRTSLLITHRFSSVRMANMVAVLEDGHITECGAHHELISLGGSYARLYTTQAEHYRFG